MPVNKFMSKTKTGHCDENRPTAEFDRFEFRSSRLIVGCKCTRTDGMQHECERLKCIGNRTLCLTYPTPTCLPSRPCPPRPIERTEDDGHNDGHRDHHYQDDQQDGHQDDQQVGLQDNSQTDTPTSLLVLVDGDGTGGDHLAKRNARYRTVNDSRRMRQWATDQYDDRPAHKTLFRPCRVHRTKVHAHKHRCKDAKAKVI